MPSLFIEIPVAEFKDPDLVLVELFDTARRVVASSVMRTGDALVLSRLIPGRAGGWVTICGLALAEPDDGVPHRVFEVSNKRVFVMPTNTGRGDPFRGGGCRELRHVIARAVALGIIGAKLEADETLTLMLGD